MTMLSGKMVCVSPDCQREKDEMRAQIKILEADLRKEQRAHQAHEVGQSILERRVKALDSAVDRAVAVLSEAAGVVGKASLEGAVKAVHDKIVELEKERRWMRGVVDSATEALEEGDGPKAYKRLAPICYEYDRDA